MSEYRLCGTECERTGQIHQWITKDGKAIDIEDFISDMEELQQQLTEASSVARELYQLLTEYNYTVSQQVLQDYPWLEEKR